MFASIRAMAVLSLVVFIPRSAVADDVRIWEEQVTIPTYVVQPADVNPRFEEGRVYQGAKGPVYPYAMLDGLTDDRVDRTYTALYLENEYVRICVLPEIGGRIFEALDKTNGYDFFYRQHVIKPDLISMLGAWISGGVEWCVFHHHRNTTFMPVDYLLAENPGGSKTIWVGETERRHRMKWTIGMTLSPGSSRLDVTVKMSNRTPYVHSILYWANVAVHATPGYQVIFPPSVQFATFHGKHEFSHWPISREVFRGTDYTSGVDVSWWKNHPGATSFFAWNPQEDFFAGYDHDKHAGVAHVADHHVVPGMKLWTWGVNSTGDRVKLTDSDGPYAEIMAGAYSDNQPDYSWIQPHEVKIFTQSWYPLRDMGGVLNANRNGAVNLTIRSERVARVALNVTSHHEHARVVMKAGDAMLFEEEVMIDPASPFSRETTIPVDVDARALRVALLAEDGGELVAYWPTTYHEQPMPEPVMPPAAPEAIETNEELYLTGLRLEQFHNPTVDPRPYYDEALKRDPGDARVNTVLGIIDCKRLDFPGAEERLRRAVARLTHDYTRPKDGEALYYLGVALAAQGKEDEARDAFRRAAWSLAWHSAAMYAVAELDCRDGDFASAIAHIDEALATNARDTKALSLRSAILRKLGRVQEALEQARAASAIDPLDFFAGNEQVLAETALDAGSADPVQALIGRMRRDVHSHLELAADYMGPAMWDEAVAVLERLDVTTETTGSAYPMLYYYLAYSLEQRGDQEAAAMYYETAADMPAEYCFPYGFESMRVLERAMEANPADGRAPYYLGNLLYDLQPENAVAAWEKARTLDPGLATLHRNLGYAYARNEEIDKAIASYEASVQCDSGDARVFYELEQIYEKAGVDPQKRLSLLNTNPETVLKRDDLIARKIQLLVEVGHYDEAIAMLTSRTFDTWEGGGGIHNVYVNAHSLRGLAAMRRGDAQSALADFTAALDYPANLGVDRPVQVPQAARTEFLIALASEAAGNEENARVHYHNAAGVDAQATEFRYHKARAMQKLGSAGDATALFDALIADGAKLLAEGAKVDFFAAFGEKQSHDTAMAQAHYVMALGHLGKGDRDKASAAFEQALQLNPNHLWARADSQMMQ